MINPSDYFKPDTTPFGQVGAYDASKGYFSQAANSALPSPESLDKAAARLRGRVDTYGRAQEQGIRDTYGGRGQTYSGGLDNALQRNSSEQYNAYASGLTDLETNYLDKQQQGAQILGQIGQGASGAANYQTSSYLDELLGKGKLFQGQEQIDTDRKSSTIENLINAFLGNAAVGSTPDDNSRFREALKSLLLGGSGGAGYPTY